MVCAAVEGSHGLRDPMVCAAGEGSHGLRCRRGIPWFTLQGRDPMVYADVFLLVLYEIAT
jgi:hypothetical protein